MAREFSRTERLGSQISQAMARILQYEFRDPRLGLCTVTEARISRDLSHVKVFVSFLGLDDAQVSEAMDVLQQAAPHLRSLLSKKIHARITPHIRFEHDDSSARGSQMDALIRKARSGDSDIRPEGDAGVDDAEGHT
jgi:ribosome-binding factor A